MSTSEFDALCDGPLAPALAGLEDARKAAVKKHWITIGIGVLIAIVALVVLRFGVFGWMIAGIAVVGAWVFASGGLNKVGRALKDPALQAIAQARGMTYTSHGFSADGYEGMHPLFGRPNSRTFTDRLTGDDGGPYALYEAVLTQTTGTVGRGSNRRRQEIFRGLIYSLKRGPVQGETVVVPDKGLFNFFKPSGQMERIKFEDDPEFEKRFEVYSTHPDEARALMNPTARQKLQQWRETYGKVFARYAADDVTVALGKRGDLFEVGSMTKSIPGRERVRGIWNHVDGAVALARELRSGLG